jgi:hypothetical protein
VGEEVSMRAEAGKSCNCLNDDDGRLQWRVAFLLRLKRA